MKTNFKGSFGKYSIEENNLYASGHLVFKSAELLPEEEIKENLNLAKDALEVRQQIEFDLPELLERCNEAVRLLDKIYKNGEPGWLLMADIREFLNKQ